MFCLQHYMPYLNKINLPEHLKGKQNVLFGNIIEIYTESKNFLAALKTCGYDHEKVAETFLRFVSNLHYTLVYIPL